MSLILRTVQAFPRGRTTEELLVLVGAAFCHDKRVSALAELEQLMRDGLVEKRRDGRWLPRQSNTNNTALTRSQPKTASSPDIIQAAAAQFGREKLDELSETSEEGETTAINPQALLRYWRSALRADPRGATTQVLDKHGIEWALISGRGPIAPVEGEKLRITISLDGLASTFREALVRREGNENVLAIGWPMAVSRRSGVPIFQPVGLLVASWERNADSLVLTVDADDVLLNPDWIKGAARASGWARDTLGDLFATEGGVGLHAEDFVGKLRDSVASQIRGRIVGQDLASQLDASSQGIFDAAAIFLPTDSSFTAGAARDLDSISDWPKERLARSALAPILGLSSENEDTFPAVSVSPLNKEQLRAVEMACSAPLTVVTGPPGTGKSQAIVSMAASVLMSGGSVLVASKNHQALDAVEDRLGELAPDTPFVTRTLKPEAELDIGFTEALKRLIEESHPGRQAYLDDLLVEEMAEKAEERSKAVVLSDKHSELECRIAEVLEAIEVREARKAVASDNSPQENRQSLWARFFSFVGGLFRRTSSGPLPLTLDAPMPKSLSGLRALLTELRKARDAIGKTGDPVALGEEIQELARKVLPPMMTARCLLTEDHRKELSEAYDGWAFSGSIGSLPTDLSRGLIAHRPLWLASILGAPRRIPLDDGLFDLVIFDEASQCDIATAIPLFARAKRAVVVGDDRQLSFIAQLGQAQDRNLMQAQGLPVGRMARFAQSKKSLFDFASTLPNVARVTLRHQYRSAGPIVEYISEAFYGGQLQTSYDPAGLIVPKGAKPGMTWEHVPAPGLPQNGNVNPAEVNAIVAHLRKLLIDQSYEGSIGVISPFRAQVLALESAIFAAIPEQHRVASDLRVGTVDGFQGQERDLILFSPCVGPRSPQTGLTFFQRDYRRLNVAISRARAVAMIFGDLEFARSGKVKALQILAARITERPVRSGESVFDSDWERKVYHALRARGLEPAPQHEIAGRRLDFALFGKNGVKLDLEVDGRRWHESPDGRRKTSDLWRDHQLKSMGWRVRRFWVDELSSDMEGCLDIIERDLA